MAVLKAFKAIRPAPGKAAEVAALPYDVMNSVEAREMVSGKPNSFLHVDKAEVDLPEDTYIYDEKVYLKARENLRRLIEDGICVQDGEPCLYIYRQIMNGRSQTGIVGCTAIDDYINNKIKKHEFTREDKEKDRINHVDHCDANTGPIFLTYRNSNAVSSITEKWILSNDPFCDFTADNVRNTAWVIDNQTVIDELISLFGDIPYLYIADGHHRAASAVKVGLKRRQEHPGYSGEEEFNYFLSVLFPDNELEIMDYNRVVSTLNGNSESTFKEKLLNCFEIEKIGKEAYKPSKRHTFGMYLGGTWYKLTAKDGICDENDPVDRLDVSILQKNVLSGLLGIDDPRTDKRIDFIGGIRGLGELEKRCSEDMAVAFAMYPTSVDDLMSIADVGRTMPPKSTWFEPKLLSGLFIHKLS